MEARLSTVSAQVGELSRRVDGQKQELLQQLLSLRESVPAAPSGELKAAEALELLRGQHDLLQSLASLPTDVLGIAKTLAAHGPASPSPPEAMPSSPRAVPSIPNGSPPDSSPYPALPRAVALPAPQLAGSDSAPAEPRVEPHFSRREPAPINAAPRATPQRSLSSPRGMSPSGASRGTRPRTPVGRATPPDGRERWADR